MPGPTSFEATIRLADTETYCCFAPDGMIIISFEATIRLADTETTK